jgi:hypothetical protein
VAVLRLVCERYGARVGRVGFKSLIDDSLLNAKASRQNKLPVYVLG